MLPNSIFCIFEAQIQQMGQKGAERLLTLPLAGLVAGSLQEDRASRSYGAARMLMALSPGIYAFPMVPTCAPGLCVPNRIPCVLTVCLIVVVVLAVVIAWLFNLRFKAISKSFDR